MLENGGDPFIKNMKGESIESILNDTEDHEDLKLLIDTARKNLSLKTTGIASPIHNAIKEGNISWLKIYKMLGANFCSFNDKGERPIETAINLDHANVDIVLFVLNQSQTLLEEETILKLVFQYLEAQVRQKFMNKSLVKKYEDLWQNLIKTGTKRGENIQTLSEMVQTPSRFVFSNLLQLAMEDGTNANNISYIQINST